MRHHLAVLPLVLLSACGGGGSDSTPPPAPNQTPRFTSAATASVAETLTAVYQAAATDPENGTISFSISGGADRTLFALSPQGALSFAAAPNFELPGDADGDNVYLVQLSASDGQASATLDLRITVTNDREGIRVRRVGTGFNQPLHVAAIPGDSRVFVLEKGGRIMLFDPATGTKSVFMTTTRRFDQIAGLVDDFSSDGERGLLGIAVDPGYATNGEFYVFVTVANGDIEIRRHRRGADGLGDPRGLLVLRIEHRQSSNHNGGWMGFGPDGHLYVAVGDGADGGDNAQNSNSRLGKILRIAKNPDPFAGATPTYFIPAPGNPFRAGGGDPYVYAIGLRNPFRAAFDNGRLLIGDVGQDAVEEIDVLGTTAGGTNFGWPFREGTRAYQGTSPAGLTGPVTEYTHGNGPRQGQSVIGGLVYRGPVTSLAGKYVFGDFGSGNIWAVRADSLIPGQLLASSSYERMNDDFQPDTDTINQIASFGEDAAGNLYIVDLDGDIFVVGRT